MKLGEYIVILPPMISQLKLSGNNLIIFALIHGFTKDGLHKFYGSIDTICERTNLSRPTVISILKNLTDNGLLNKEEQVTNNIKTCLYTTNYDELIGGGKETLLPVKKLNWGSKETLPNNKTLIDNKSIRKGKGTLTPLILPFSSEKFLETWEALCEEKNWKSKTRKALQLSLNKLGRYAEEFAIELMEKAIEGGWKGVVFPDTDAKYQEWMSARQHKLECQQPRTSQPQNKKANRATAVDEFYAKMRAQREAEERAMMEQISKFKEGHGNAD